MTSRLYVLLLSALFFTSTQESIAGSLVLEHLATVASVTVQALAPHYEPILGISPRALEEKIEATVHNVFLKHDLPTSVSADQRLLIHIDYEDAGPAADTIALLIRAELSEPAVLAREWSGATAPTLTITSWQETWFEFVPRDSIHHKLCEAAKIVATEFVEEVIQAENYQERAAAYSGSDQQLSFAANVEQPAPETKRYS